MTHNILNIEKLNITCNASFVDRGEGYWRWNTGNLDMDNIYSHRVQSKTESGDEVLWHELRIYSSGDRTGNEQFPLSDFINIKDSNSENELLAAYEHLSRERGDREYDMFDAIDTNIHLSTINKLYKLSLASVYPLNYYDFELDGITDYLNCELLYDTVSIDSAVVIFLHSDLKYLGIPREKLYETMQIFLDNAACLNHFYGSIGIAFNFITDRHIPGNIDISIDLKDILDDITKFDFNCINIINAIEKESNMILPKICVEKILDDFKQLTIPDS